MEASTAWSFLSLAEGPIVQHFEIKETAHLNGLKPLYFCHQFTREAKRKNEIHSTQVACNRFPGLCLRHLVALKESSNFILT